MHPQIARALARAGTPREEAAVIIGIDVATFDLWASTHPAFAQALREGREFARARVEDTLYRRATGYDFETSIVEQEPDGSKKITVEKKHVPGDVNACIFWLRVHGQKIERR